MYCGFLSATESRVVKENSLWRRTIKRWLFWRHVADKQNKLYTAYLNQKDLLYTKRLIGKISTRVDKNKAV